MLTSTKVWNDHTCIKTKEGGATPMKDPIQKGVRGTPMQ